MSFRNKFFAGLFGVLSAGFAFTNVYADELKTINSDNLQALAASQSQFGDKGIVISYVDVNGDGRLDQVIRYGGYSVIVLNPGTERQEKSFDVYVGPREGRNIENSKKIVSADLPPALPLETLSQTQLQPQIKSQPRGPALEKIVSDNSATADNKNQPITAPVTPVTPQESLVEKAGQVSDQFEKGLADLKQKSQARLVKCSLYEKPINDVCGYFQWSNGDRLSFFQNGQNRSAEDFENAQKYSVKNFTSDFRDFNGDGFLDGVVEWKDGYRTPLIRVADSYEELVQDVVVNTSSNGSNGGRVCTGPNCPYGKFSQIGMNPSGSPILQPSSLTEKRKFSVKIRNYVHGSQIEKDEKEHDFYKSLEKSLNPNF